MTMAGINSKMSTRILDLGGGCGMYFPVVNSFFFKLGMGLKYAVVDGMSSCKIGSACFSKCTDIKFFNFQQNGVSKACQWLGKVDLVNCAGTLHYLLDWKEAILNITALEPRMVVVSRHPTPDNAIKEGYVLQNVTTIKGYCGIVPVVLIPRNLLFLEMASQGYECIAENGSLGDANWYWQEGCSQDEFKIITNRSFVFFKVKN